MSQCVHPICWGPKPKRRDQDKATGETREVLWYSPSLVVASSFFHVTISNVRHAKCPGAGAAPRFCRMLRGMLVHLGQKWGADGATEGWL